MTPSWNCFRSPGVSSPDMDSGIGNRLPPPPRPPRPSAQQVEDLEFCINRPLSYVVKKMLNSPERAPGNESRPPLPLHMRRERSTYRRNPIANPVANPVVNPAVDPIRISQLQTIVDVSIEGMSCSVNMKYFLDTDRMSRHEST